MRRLKKISMFLSLLLLGFSLLSAQSLYELAQQEKKRRSKYKDKKVLVVTNADLMKSPKRPAVSVKAAPAAAKAQSPASPRVTVRSSENPRVTVAQDTAPRQDTRQTRGGNLKYATKVLAETQNVENPQLALGRPDGQYARINYLGFIDLEFAVNNGSGDDFIVHARRQDAGSPMPNLNYFVYVKPDRGDWEAIGMGTGTGGSESFDLGDFKSADRIRIVFREVSRRSLEGALLGTGEQSIMRIDAVEALH